MQQEIERKFLVREDRWIPPERGERILQGYLSREVTAVVRVRLKGNRAYLTIKGKNEGISRPEYEYPIPPQDAVEILKMAKAPVVEKTRYTVPYGEHNWEVDVFAGENAGLVLAEIELSSPTEKFLPPPWLGEEVSTDPRYYNVNLLAHPFKSWAISTTSGENFGG
ncbi:MAG: CYTH domain-containing protein [Selenomonadaceae bacterium]|nr:CYTH domain-containing protein [Selenomonadaceae bacterium]